MAAFIALPNQLSAQDPHYVAPLNIEREQTFSPTGSLFMKRAEVKFWLARQGGRAVGRISAQIDPLDTQGAALGIGQFGCIAAIDDAAVFGALLSTAEQFLKARGRTVSRGPF